MLAFVFLWANADQLPTIELGWQLPQITFVAQGAGPFRLLSGSAKKAQRVNFPSRLVSDNNTIEVVKLLPAITIKRDLSLSSEEDEAVDKYSWRTLLLWLVLLIGVFIMGVMTYKLARSMGEDENKKP